LDTVTRGKLATRGFISGVITMLDQTEPITGVALHYADLRNRGETRLPRTLTTQAGRSASTRRKGKSRAVIFSRLPAMDLKDATLMILAESGAHPRLAELARSAHDQLITAGDVDYHVLDDMIAEASGKGVLRTIRQKHGAVAHEAIFGPILREIDRQKPVPPRRPASDRQDGLPRTLPPS
jgi:hypothetical protein